MRNRSILDGGNIYKKAFVAFYPHSNKRGTTKAKLVFYIGRNDSPRIADMRTINSGMKITTKKMLTRLYYSIKRTFSVAQIVQPAEFLIQP